MLKIVVALLLIASGEITHADDARLIVKASPAISTSTNEPASTGTPSKDVLPQIEVIQAQNVLLKDLYDKSFYSVWSMLAILATCNVGFMALGWFSNKRISDSEIKRIQLAYEEVSAKERMKIDERIAEIRDGIAQDKEILRNSLSSSHQANNLKDTQEKNQLSEAIKVLEAKIQSLYDFAKASGGEIMSDETISSRLEVLSKEETNATRNSIWKILATLVPHPGGAGAMRSPTRYPHKMDELIGNLLKILEPAEGAMAQDLRFTEPEYMLVSQALMKINSSATNAAKLMTAIKKYA